MSPNVLHTLDALLQTATRIVEDIAGVPDELFQRLARVFGRMPEEDRADILAVLEREVDMRLLMRSGEPSVSGYEIIRPNPSARLYVRGFTTPPKFLDTNHLMRAVLRVARMVVRAPDAGQADWTRETLDAVRYLDPGERGAIARAARRFVELLDRFEQETPAKAS